MQKLGNGRYYRGITCISVFLFLMSWCLVVQAQKGTLNGFVFDAETSEPLAYANIIIEGTDKGTYTKADGSYSLKLDSGQVAIRYRFVSFRDTVIQVNIQPNERVVREIYLQPERMELDVTVSANRVARKVQKLARLRDQRKSNLRNYKADVYKLAILSKMKKEESYDSLESKDVEPIAFSERKSKVKYTAKPERYSETVEANRASDNFFSEYDFFSTGGSPLNLNKDEVTLSILSEDITVVGPVSKKAGRFYELYDREADSSWPSGTVEVYFEPKKNNRPLFDGKVWYDEETSVILGIDVRLNEYTDTHSGTFSVSNLRYQQSYEKEGDFWLPETTELSATLSFFTSSQNIWYHDEWTWSDFSVNENRLEAQDIKLSTTRIKPDAHQKEDTYWDSISTQSANRNTELLDEAKNHEEDQKAVKFGMSAMRAFFRLPYQLERFYLTNFSHIYHYNRVEGHYLGLGLRTPVHPDYDYRAIGGYGFGNEAWSYKLSGYHFLGDFFAAPEFSYYKQTVQQYQDYEYNRTPLDFFQARQTLRALATGSTGNNYFEREGWQAGIRFRYAAESFLRVLYVQEQHEKLTSSSTFSIFGDELPPEEFSNNHPNQPATNGNVNGLYIQLHHDSRQYLRTQFLRDYNIREFGWLADAVLEKGISDWGSSFDYNRYRLGLKFYWPVFSSHFLQTDIIVGAADAGTPNQRLFTYNGYVVDDYVRFRPFYTVNYREPLGNRISLFKVRYKFGSSLTRSIPIKFIQKSGIQLSSVFTVATIDDKDSLVPLLPQSGSKTQAEFGIAASKIFGIFYAEVSKKIYGSYGSSVGFTILF